MVSRAFVESIVDQTHVRVRIPRLNKISGAVGSTPTTELNIATICTLPGCKPRLQRGDVVLVAYEDDDDGSPVVLGLLFQPTMKSTSDVSFDSLEVKVNSVLPEDTNIGELNEDTFKMLSGLRDNVQTQIDTQTVAQTKANKAIEDLIESINSLEAAGVAKKAAYYGKTNPRDLSPGVEGQIYLYIEE